MSELAPAPKRRVRRAARVVLPSIAAAAVTAVGFAAFTDDARNAGNSASAASVTISEDVGASTPLFDLANWQPAENDTVSRCIAVTNDGSIALPLSLRFERKPTGELGDYVDMTIERGTRPAATNSADCGGFESAGTVWQGELDEFPTTGAGRVADGGSPLGVKAERAYRVTWKLQDDEAAEGKSISDVSFLWETTSAD